MLVGAKSAGMVQLHYLHHFSRAVCKVQIVQSLYRLHCIAALGGLIYSLLCERGKWNTRL